MKSKLEQEKARIDIKMRLSFSFIAFFILVALAVFGCMPSTAVEARGRGSCRGHNCGGEGGRGSGGGRCHGRNCRGGRGGVHCRGRNCGRG